MRLPHGSFTAAIVLGFVSVAYGFAIAQAPADPPDAAPPAAPQTPAAPTTSGDQVKRLQSGLDKMAEPPSPLGMPCRPGGQEYEPMDEKAPCAAAAKKTYTVPAGTKVLLQLRSSINTKSAKPGDGVYLSSTFPVVVGNRVMIPAGVYVQGVVDRVARAGHVKGRAQLDLHFTSIIFPNGSVVEIPGIINSLPGAKDRTVKGDEGTIEQNGDKGHDVARAAQIGLEGAGVGTIGGAATGHPLEGAAIGGLGGVAVGAVVALFTRGNDINIESGTPVEMVLQRPLILEDENLGSAPPGTAPALVPSAHQLRPIGKPDRARILCPPGGLGCE